MMMREDTLLKLTDYERSVVLTALVGYRHSCLKITDPRLRQIAMHNADVALTVMRKLEHEPFGIYEEPRRQPAEKEGEG